MDSEKVFVACEALAEAIRGRGLKAYVGKYWDGACDHNDYEFWYFNPSAESQRIGIYYEVNGVYDSGFIDASTIDQTIIRIESLNKNPSKEEVWDALDGS